MENPELFYVKYNIEVDKYDAFDKYLSDRKILTQQVFVKDLVVDDNGNEALQFNELRIDENKTIDAIRSEFIKNRTGKDMNIYVFNNAKPFTLILFDSRDEDSVLCKDIIVKQYVTVYNRDVTDWTKNGIVIYDTYLKVSEYPTYTIGEGEAAKKFNIFNPYLLSETDVDEVFVCGLCISKELLNRFSTYNEKLFIFEQNPFNINEIYSTLRFQYSGKLCMNKSKTKAYQAFLLFRDPIDNIKPEDNLALKILYDYSSIVCHSFANFGDWEKLEILKENFEEHIVDESFKRDFVDLLFGNKSLESTINAFKLYECETTVEPSTEFDEVVKNCSIDWTGNTLALNTDVVPSAEQVKKLVAENSQRYSKIVTFKKNDNLFWTVRLYTAPRSIGEPISISSNEIVNGVEYYTENGMRVYRNVLTDGFGKTIGVEWFVQNGKKKTEVNAYVPATLGDYVLNLEDKSYEEFNSSKEYNADEYAFTSEVGGTVKRFNKSLSKTNVFFDKVYASKDAIDFNRNSLITLIGTKYYCTGNKYVVEASLTDKQMYDCLKTKSII